MKGIVQIYRALFSSRLFPLHFQYINGCFVRVHGEIIQSLQLQRFSCVKQCTIVFALIPLCQKIDYFDVGLYNLRDFTIPPTLQQADSWTYDASEASKTACIQEMLALVEKDLIPLFEKCSECKETLSALLDLEMRKRTAFFASHSSLYILRVCPAPHGSKKYGCSPAHHGILRESRFFSVSSQESDSSLNL